MMRLLLIFVFLCAGICAKADSIKYPGLTIKSGPYYYKEVRPVGGSQFSKIDSIIDNTDLRSILKILDDSVIPVLKKKPRIYMDSVVDNYRYYSVRFMNGDSLLYLEQLYPVHVDYDYALSIKADDFVRQSGYRFRYPDMWDYAMETGEKTYLFSKLLKSDFQEADGQIEVEEYWDPDGIVIPLFWGSTIWTFPIKEGKLVGAFVTFPFADPPINPVWDIINEKFVYPELYMIKREENGRKILYTREEQDSAQPYRIE